VRVTHWTEEDVKREQELELRFSATEPDVVLESYSQLLEEFQFEASPLLLNSTIVNVQDVK
jgi:hypothetical protein